MFSINLPKLENKQAAKIWSLTKEKLGKKCTYQKVYIHKISKKYFSLYASSRPKLNFGCYFTFEITF